MKVLLVSYYVESHLPSSAAQNSRLIAKSLVGAGHEVRVVCAAATAGVETVDGYRLTKLPLSSPSWKSQWLGTWRPDERIREIACRYFAEWRPDVVLMGAWAELTEFVLEARRRDVPAVQIVHDYSILCLRQWLLDSSGNLCSGPTSEAKCRNCIEGSLGVRASLRNRLLSLPRVPSLATAFLGPAYLANHHAPTAVEDAWRHMETYRGAMTLFVAQAPSVVDLLASAGIEASRCRFLPQFIGDEKLERYPRPVDPPGGARPLRFAYVGRWSYEKGPDILLEAFQTAVVSLDMDLRIISRNADRSALEAGGRCSKRVEVVNDAHGPEVSKLLAQCDVCVVPSRCRELASRVVLEANAQGVPVVASDTVGNSYLIEDRVNGRVIASGSVKALRGCIEEIAAAPAVLREWSQNVPTPVGRAEWSTLVMDILEEAVQTPSRS